MTLAVSRNDLGSTWKRDTAAKRMVSDDLRISCVVNPTRAAFIRVVVVVPVRIVEEPRVATFHEVNSFVPSSNIIE